MAETIKLEVVTPRGAVFSDDVDIVIRSLLARMTAVWTCQKRFGDAVADGDIEVFGDENLVANLPDWLQASGLSLLGAQSMEAQS